MLVTHKPSPRLETVSQNEHLSTNYKLYLNRVSPKLKQYAKKRFEEVVIENIEAPKQPLKFETSKKSLERDFYARMMSLDKKRSFKFTPLG